MTGRSHKEKSNEKSLNIRVLVGGETYQGLIMPKDIS